MIASIKIIKTQSTFMDVLNFQQNTKSNHKGETSAGTTSTRSLPPLRMKPETSNLRLNIPHQVSDVNIKRKSNCWSSSDDLSNKIMVSSVREKDLSNLQTIPSRKCTVLDLLFDREVSIKQGSIAFFGCSRIFVGSVD